jgi:ATP-dependent RNA helicase DDX52/ROK1
LKKRGVESRRSHLKGKEARKGRISTKSGFERREENRKKGAVEGAKRRGALESKKDEGEGSDFEGFEE